MFNFTCTQSQEATPFDQYLVYGEDYKTIRDAVGNGILEGKMDALDGACKVMSGLCFV